ncbi:hypothetical protein VIGAN_08244100 [Vigna angularis var. angularis]|uniref:Uncharacterized protein n=1 Tax=Vigna angularis var. angularis TaxID=157739 RepID=A0A0S3SS78_PHAAN|nr:hypothetical protein VIGAN_08244100 [Vigna angularis var. angularis]
MEAFLCFSSSFFGVMTLIYIGSSIAYAISILLMLIALIGVLFIASHRCNDSRIWLCCYFCFDRYTRVGFVFPIIINVGDIALSNSKSINMNLSRKISIRQGSF